MPIGSSIAYDNDISMNPLNVHFLDGSVLIIDSLEYYHPLDLEPTLRFDLSKYKNVDYYSFRSAPIEGYHYLQDSYGPQSFILRIRRIKTKPTSQLKKKLPSCKSNPG